jgi:hypothetical protein
VLVSHYCVVVDVVVVDNNTIVTHQHKPLIRSPRTYQHHTTALLISMHIFPPKMVIRPKHVAVIE